MPIMELTEANFDEVINQNELVLVDFWAEWCGPCKAFAPTYAEVAERYPQIVFGKVDTEAQPTLARDFQIRSIPTIMVIKQQVVLYVGSGSMPASALDELVQQAQGVDMATIETAPDDKPDGK